ncbi:MAG TPA: hypothetical protein ENK96_03215 [Desulfobulbaceae bacterium]|nr:hypothetical protein [Desulfobulbaceae bacterium]
MFFGKKSLPGCSGYCKRCGRNHYLDSVLARTKAEKLMAFMDKYNHINLMTPKAQVTSRYTTNLLFSSAQGKMFGVLLCRNALGKEIVLYGFSGQFNGQWQVPGWVGPLFDERAFHQCADDTEREIKALGRSLEREAQGSDNRRQLKEYRRNLSRKLMQTLFSLYRVPDFRGNIYSLEQAFTGKTGMPTGTGDCCAPKLLAHAATHHLRPVSLSEFYYGRENSSGTRVHKQFYSACEEKCRPILGTMLCGIEECHGCG